MWCPFGTHNVGGAGKLAVPRPGQSWWHKGTWHLGMSVVLHLYFRQWLPRSLEGRRCTAGGFAKASGPVWTLSHLHLSCLFNSQMYVLRWLPIRESGEPRWFVSPCRMNQAVSRYHAPVAPLLRYFQVYAGVANNLGVGNPQEGFVTSSPGAVNDCALPQSR